MYKRSVGEELTDIAAQFPSFGVPLRPDTFLAPEASSSLIASQQILYPWRGDEAPAWLNAVTSRFFELQALGNDWDGYGSPAPSPSVVFAAFERFGAIIPINAPAPAIFPTTSGGVQFEWTVGGRHIEIEYLPGGAIEAWGEDVNTGQFWEGDSSDITAKLPQALTALSQESVGY
jgi:hypothetical protein